MKWKLGLNPRLKYQSGIKSGFAAYVLVCGNLTVNIFGNHSIIHHDKGVKVGSFLLLNLILFEVLALKVNSLINSVRCGLSIETCTQSSVDSLKCCMKWSVYAQASTVQLFALVSYATLL